VVTAKVGDGAGATATIEQETNYPFSETVRFKFTMSATAKFPLALRTPAWCEVPSITVNGERVDAAKPGAFAKITREWKSGDEVVVKLPMAGARAAGRAREPQRTSRAARLCAADCDGEARGRAAGARVR
jgi:DUF1680 family protein